MPPRYDYYQVLEIPRDASVDDIKAAYRKKAMKHHPDVSDEPDAEERFKRVQEAYETLTNTSKRTAYDREGASRDPWERMNTRTGSNPYRDFASDPLFRDLFEHLRRNTGATGSGWSHLMRERGGDISVQIMIDLKEATFGCSKTVTFERDEECPTCGIHRNLSSLCQNCRGLRRRKYIRSGSIDIPPGFIGGNQIISKGKGHHGKNGGPPGDLKFEVRINKHPVFGIEGSLLVVSVSVDAVAAMVGMTVKVPSFDGLLSVDLPKGIQSGQFVMVPGFGIPSTKRTGRTGRGPLKVKIEVKTSTELDDEQTSMIQYLAADMLKKDPRALEAEVIRRK